MSQLFLIHAPLSDLYTALLFFIFLDLYRVDILVILAPIHHFITLFHSHYHQHLCVLIFPLFFIYLSYKD